MTLKDTYTRVFSQLRGAAFAVEFWDGDRISYGTEPEEFTLVLRDENVCAALFGNPSVRFCEAYTAGAIDVRGDLKDVFRTIFLNRLETLRLSLREKLRIGWMAWRQRNSVSQARCNIAHHYDLGNDFYRLWLGTEMAYSCAYFHDRQDDIDTAQNCKFRYICRKLQLAPGESFLDIGCGWGGLILFAAREFGVRALGITLSTEQFREAQMRIAAAGADDGVAVQLTDYRQLPRGEAFDKLASVGMLEHVGRENLGQYMRSVAQLLRNGGIGLLQSIGHMHGAPTNPWIRKHIFPGTYLPSLSEITDAMQCAGLVVIDVEDLRRHYALTFERWSEAFEEHVGAIRAMYSEAFVRMWRVYLRSVTASFQWSEHRLFQIQFTKGLSEAVPLTREYLYR